MGEGWRLWLLQLVDDWRVKAGVVVVARSDGKSDAGALDDEHSC